MKTHASQEKTAERNMIELESGCLVQNLNVYDDCSNTCGVFITQHFLSQTSLHFMKCPHLCQFYSLFLGLQLMSYLWHYCQIIQLYLQFVQDAISKQLDALSDTSPSLRVGIITFSDEVSVITY